MIFGKTISQYVAFQKGILAVIAAVGILRLVLSLAGVADSATRWISMTALAIASIVYYGVTVYTKGFGTYRHLLPLLVIQSVVANVIVIVGILIAAGTGKPNIFTAPEYGGNSSVAFHIGGHVIAGMIVGPLIGWAIASLVMLITKKMAPTRVAATTA